MSLPIPKKILLVEDEPLLLKFVRTVLERAGYSVLAVASREEAIRIERDFKETIDLLLTGFSLARISGPELAAKLKRRRRGLRVMLMSSDPNAHLLALCNGWAFTQKPFAANQVLVDNIRDALALDVEMPAGHVHPFDTIRYTEFESGAGSSATAQGGWRQYSLDCRS